MTVWEIWLNSSSRKLKYLLKVVPTYNRTTSKKSLSGQKENTCMAISPCPDTSWCEKAPILHLEEAEQSKNCCPCKRLLSYFWISCLVLINPKALKLGFHPDGKRKIFELSQIFTWMETVEL